MGEVGCYGVLLCTCFLEILVGDVDGLVGSIGYRRNGRIIG